MKNIRYHDSHATDFAAAIMAFYLLLLIRYSAAATENDNEARISSKEQSNGFLFNPKIQINPSMPIILVCLITAFFIMGCVSVSIRHCFQHDLDFLADDRIRRLPRLAGSWGLSSSVIDTFPTFQYSDVKDLRLGKGVLECAVCLNEFQDDETLRLLPKCSHAFHPDCIDAWLASHVTCPVCRANLASPETGDQSGADGSGDGGSGSGDVDLDPQTHDSVSELPISGPANYETSNSFGIHMHIGSPRVINPNQTAPRIFPKWPRVNGSFMRSQSTGHSLVQHEQNYERYTLRLPEDIRTRLINSELIRAKSCVAFTRVGSSTKGYRSSNSGVGGGLIVSKNGLRFDREVRSEEFGYTVSPGFFVSRASPHMEGTSEAKLSATPKSSLSSAKSFKRLFSGAGNDFDGERSFSKLRLDNNSSV